MHDVTGDGSCFFHAVIGALKHVAPWKVEEYPETPQGSKKLRGAVVNTMKNNQNVKEFFMMNKGGFKTFDAYLSKLRSPKTFADNALVFATAEFLNVNIKIYGYEPKAKEVRTYYPFGNDPKKTEVVLFNLKAKRGEEHFGYLLKPWEREEWDHDVDSD